MVEIIPKKLERELPLKNIILFIAGVLLLVVIFGYVILLRSEAKDLLVIQDLEDNIVKVGTKEDKAMEEKVFKFEDKIKDFKVLWVDRRKSSEFFDNFGTLIHPKVWFSSFNLDVAGLQAVVSGDTADFRTLEQQLIFLQGKSDIVKSFELSNLSFGEEGEGVSFDLTIDFTPKIFSDQGGSASGGKVLEK